MEPNCEDPEPAVSIAAENLFHPASGNKLLTAAAALLALGEDFAFWTELLCDDPLAGHLWVRGYGDPSFTRADMCKLAASASAAGITGATSKHKTLCHIGTKLGSFRVFWSRAWFEI
jgi:D-alanyl-D-alanine carboxypeptidase/D-alanyl-D-alanine-endopeptidase (penicillin-binding protein 4)